tara:strand:- start:2794 stop:3111 length:318 start_codon:yes stop_codon:yes gene_type:complete
MLDRKHNNNQRRTLAALGSCGQSWELTVGYEEDDYQVMVGHKSEVFFPNQQPYPWQTGILALFDIEAKRAHIHEWYTSKAERYILIGIATELGYEIEAWDKDIPY